MLGISLRSHKPSREIKFNGLGWLNGFGCYRAREELRIYIFRKIPFFFYHHPHFGKIFIQYVDKEQFVALRMNGTTAAKPTCWTRIELQMLT